MFYSRLIIDPIHQRNLATLQVEVYETIIPVPLFVPIYILCFREICLTFAIIKFFEIMLGKHMVLKLFYIDKLSFGKIYYKNTNCKNI